MAGEKASVEKHLDRNQFPVPLSFFLFFFFFSPFGSLFLPDLLPTSVYSTWEFHFPIPWSVEPTHSEMILSECSLTPSSFVAPFRQRGMELLGHALRSPLKWKVAIHRNQAHSEIRLINRISVGPVKQKQAISDRGRTKHVLKTVLTVPVFKRLHRLECLVTGQGDSCNSCSTLWLVSPPFLFTLFSWSISLSPVVGLLIDKKKKECLKWTEVSVYVCVCVYIVMYMDKVMWWCLCPWPNIPLIWSHQTHPCKSRLMHLRHSRSHWYSHSLPQKGISFARDHWFLSLPFS